MQKEAENARKMVKTSADYFNALEKFFQYALELNKKRKKEERRNLLLLRKGEKEMIKKLKQELETIK